MSDIAEVKDLITQQGKAAAEFRQKNDERLAQLAVRVWGCEASAEGPEATAREGIARFRGFLASLGMPVTLGEIGAGTDDVEAMAYETCHAGGRTGRVGGFVSLGEKDVRRILELAL